MRLIPAAAILVIGSAWPMSAFAYRPFDSTDAAVADLNAFEIEASPLSFEHSDEGSAYIAPQLRLNYGFAQDWEIVLEGQADHFTNGTSQLSEAMLSLKSVWREGSLQKKSGVSLASEESILLPGIGTQNGAGFEWTGIASQRWDWGTVHFNLAASLTRDQRLGTFVGLVLEGPDDWSLRPVAEWNFQREFGVMEEMSVLVGAIYKVRDNFALDFALRHARVAGRPDEQVRLGATFDL